MDLFAVAVANAASLEERFDALRSGMNAKEGDYLERFAKCVEKEGRISINMRLTELNSFLTFGRHQNIYEWARSRAERSSKTVGDIMRERLGPFHELRVTFDGHFDNGQQFRYGALNIGGIGPTCYGEFCVVLADCVSSERPEVAYLRTDSLKTYMLVGPSVDEAAIRRDIAPHTHRQFLAAIKHEREIHHLSENEWPCLLCCNANFVESIFTGGLTPDALEAVRILKSDHDFLHQHAFKDFRAPLSDVDRFRVDDFVMILQHLENRRIPLEEVEDA